MFPSAFRYAVGVVCLVALLSPAPGQDNRQFFKKPETVPEYFRALQYEIELGKFDLAADYLEGLLAKNPSEEDLVGLEERFGIASFLKLLNVPKWLEDPKADAETKKKAQDLVEKASAAVRKHLGDPGRIDKFIKNLSASPEERSYAIAQLRRSGAAAVPPLVAALVRSADNLDTRNQILSALPQLSKDAMPPLFAALDVNDPTLKLALIDALVRRSELSAVPHLWYLAGSAKESPLVRQKAADALGQFLGLPPGKLPSSKAALAQEAEKYYQHRIPFVNPAAVTVWRWDGKGLVSQTVPASTAEEYFGLRFARQALDLDPGYAPAQVMYLSIALDKGFERAGLDKPLAQGAPDVKELLSTVNPDLVYAVLQRGLTDRRTPVVLGAVRALGDLRDVRAAKSSGHGASALVQALNYPDRRVQFAAVEALLRIPAAASPAAPARVVEILRRTIATDSAARALVADFNEDRGNALGAAVKAAGFEPVVVRSGREVLRRLNQAGDIDVVLIHADTPDPMLPGLLAQLRADINVGLLPVVVLTPAEKADRVSAVARGYANVTVVPAALDAESLKKALPAQIAAAAGKPLSEEEKKQNAADAMNWLRRIAAGEVRGYDLRPAERDILAALRNDELALNGAIEVAGHLPGREAQSALAAVVMAANRPARIRSAAALELVRHLQQNTQLLTAAQAKALEDLLPTLDDAKLKANVALVVGSLRPPADRTGARLTRYVPPLAAPAPPPAPAKEEKKEEVKEEKKESK